jgi:hypothetical protein
MSTEGDLSRHSEEALVLTALNPTKIPRIQKFAAWITNLVKLV